MTTEKITIYEVAAKAGVSISTVSKALANKSGISAATRQQVWDAAHSLGFVPSLAARSLTGGKTGIIGLLVPYSPEQLFSDPHLLGNIHGIEQALNEQNYNLLLATAQKEHDPVSSYERLFRANYFDGVIVMETQESRQHELHRRLAEKDLPWVILGYPAGITPCYSVYADDFQGGQMAAEHLLAL
jgi:DNA-binding LacI/PurR family transcriptional regulator